MTDRTELQKIGERTKSYFDQYCAVIEPYRKELWSYCLRITGSPWDAEVSSVSHRQQPIHPRSYLFRVATNHWIDLCRKQKFLTYEFSDETTESESTEIDPIELHEAFEKLLQYLPPRQVAVVVLIDAFKYTAAETAQIIGTTEGAVTALLHRARGKLKKMRNENFSRSTTPKIDNQMISQYVSCFNKRDFKGMAQLLADNAVFSFVAQNSKEYGRDTIMKASHHPRHYKRSDLQAFVYELWGKKAVIFAKVSADGKPAQLNEVLSFEVEDNKIIKISGYYFCPEFMEMAAKEMGLPREAWNWVG